MNPILGFAPDADPITPGIMTECNNIIPHEHGMKGAPTGITAGFPALGGVCQGAAVSRRLDGTRRIIAGTPSAIYELLGGAWTDISKAGGYLGGTDSRWSICQFGDSTIAANGSDTIQRSLNAGVFSSIATAPKAAIVFSVGSVVMALNIDDGDIKTDGWANSAIFDETSWTPDIATQANSGRLVSSPGPITAGGRLGEFAIAYKERAIYVGQFVGGATTFDWVQVPGGGAGCVGIEAWCDVRGSHFVVGPDNIWFFDGTRPTPLGDGQVRQWFYNNSSQVFRYKTKCIYDEQNDLVWVCFPGKLSEIVDTALVYHIHTKQWGKVSIGVNAVLNFIQPGVTYDGLPAYSSTMEGLPNVAVDSQYWLSGGRSLAVFDSSNNLVSMTGEAGTGDFTTGDLGDDDQVTTLTKLRIRFQKNPLTAKANTLHKMNEGDALTAKPSVFMSNGHFDVRQSGRFHRARFELTGDCKFNAIRPTIVQSGER